jgi:hypothetical protein
MRSQMIKSRLCCSCALHQGLCCLTSRRLPDRWCAARSPPCRVSTPLRPPRPRPPPPGAAGAGPRGSRRSPGCRASAGGAGAEQLSTRFAVRRSYEAQTPLCMPSQRPTSSPACNLSSAVLAHGALHGHFAAVHANALFATLGTQHRQAHQQRGAQVHCGHGGPLRGPLAVQAIKRDRHRKRVQQ